MKTALTTLAVAASLTLTAASGAFAMTSEVNQVTGALYNALAQRGLPTDNLQNLTMAEILKIEQILSNGDSTGEMRNSIANILNK